MDDNTLSNSNTIKKQRGGWRAVTFILGNESLEKLGAIGLTANFMVYLTREFQLTQVSASNVMNIWSGFTNLTLLLGGYICDTYIGKFRAIAYGSFAYLLGMMTLTLIVGLPQLHPSCNLDQKQLGQCNGPNNLQFGVLVMALGLLSIGSGGIRPCSIPFGVDQFDPSTKEGKKGIISFFNWYYLSLTLILLITLTLVVYIQDSVSWVWGFGIPTIFMATSIVLFFVGAKTYIKVKPGGSIFTSIAQVIVSLYVKREIKLPKDLKTEINGDFYNPPLEKDSTISKLPFTNQFRFLNKAAMITENDLNPDGSPTSRWRISSIQQVEELKCLIKIIPIWSAGIINSTAMTQQGTFAVLQGLRMDRHLGPNFQVPAGSIGVISLLTIIVWIPIYDKLIVPSLRKITKHEGGITQLQRMGIGLVFSVIAMLVSGLVEKKRRTYATNMGPHDEPMSFFWLAPQLVLMGFNEAFCLVGQIEFFNREFPNHMKSFANSLIFICWGVASYVSTIVVNIVHRTTGSYDRPDWLTNDINDGRLDYFYYIIAGMSGFNLVYFVYCASRYRYMGSAHVEDKSLGDVEISETKRGEIV